MKMRHINITIPADLKLKLDTQSKRESIGRSTLIQKAVAFYLDLVRRKNMRKLLAEGYAEMSGESIKISEEFEELDNEISKYVD